MNSGYNSSHLRCRVGVYLRSGAYALLLRKPSPAQMNKTANGRNAKTLLGSESPAAAIKSKRKNPIAVAMSLSVFILQVF